MRHVLSALVQNQPGVLAHISGMLASRGFNIDSLAVGETEDANLSRMTFVVHGDDAELEQVRKQLHKVVTVVKVHDISSEDFVERDLMLIKVKTAPSPAPPRQRRSLPGGRHPRQVYRPDGPSPHTGARIGPTRRPSSSCF